ncbi:HD-GYP domain-containing protein [Falsiroseomonas selenitidurans]|uniref:HD domain-containing protein n=1 Tax=Falsiroseomonas selenitidurans TaxID=2716335 RepID=A0ABX1E4P7_9PROT|nr:HD domain-containing phosphohydrolase [Falsiroseomonas selenitidurans]NKC32162.1 HD domain-containing protein [Falsiroseomonas selenitidurans]
MDGSLGLGKLHARFDRHAGREAGITPAGPGAACSPPGSTLRLEPTLALLGRLRRHHAPSAEHSMRVARVAMAMWRQGPALLGEAMPLLTGALLHDIGKLHVAAATLDGDRRLDAAELASIRRHPALGAALLARLDFPPLVILAARDHHERWAGGGYPTGVAASGLHPVTRAVAVADSFVAMVEPGRRYRTRMTAAAALAEIAACRGTQFDPAMADLLNAALAGQPCPADAPRT